jgi:RNA polymerase sigma-70 factor (ECF subfamily)
VRRTSGNGDGAAERRLLKRIADRDRSAMRDFYLLYHRRLARFLTRITSRFELAEEVINDTMMLVWNQAERFRDESRVSTWIMGIAYRQALRALRSATRADAHAVAPEWQEEVVFESLDAERRDWLDKALGALSPEHRVTLELTYYGGFSSEEIAAIMGCPASTVKTRMFYGREKLREVLPALATPTRHER